MDVKSASRRIATVITLLLSALLAGGVAASCGLLTNSSFNMQSQERWLGPTPVRVSEGVRFRWGDDVSWTKEDGVSEAWKPFPFPGQAPGRGDHDSLWLSIPLPRQTFTDATLFLLAVDSQFEVWLEGKRLAASGTFQGPRRNDFLGYPWTLVPLPPGYEGKNALLRVQSTHDNIGPYGDIFVGPRATQLARILRTDLQKFIIGAVIFVAGIGLLFLFLRRRQERIYFGFAMVCITLGGYIVCRSSLKQLFLYAPVSWFVLELICFYFLPWSLCQFTDAIFGKTLYTHVTRITTVYAVIAFGLMAVGVVPVLSTLMPFQILFLACVAAFLWELFRRLGRGNLDPKVLAFGFLGLTASGVHDVLLAMGVFASPVEMSHWGLLCVVGSMSAITVRRFAEVYASMEASSQALALKTVDLEGKNADLVRMSEDLGRVAVKLGDKLNTPLEVMMLASEEIEDHFEEHIKDAALRSELAHLFDVFRHSTESIRTELAVLAQFKRFAPRGSLEEDLTLRSFPPTVVGPASDSDPLSR